MIFSDIQDNDNESVCIVIQDDDNESVYTAIRDDNNKLVYIAIQVEYISQLVPVR
jgi:hypothetical protein